MTTQPNLALLEQAITKVDTLTDAVQTLTELFASEKQSQRAHRLWGLISAVAFAVLFSFGLWSVYHADNVTRNACQISNGDKVLQRQLWEGLLALPKTPGTPDTPPETIKAFNGLLDRTFGHRDCG